MTYMTDSIDWIEHMEEDMRAYENVLRLIKKAKETAEVSYIMENLHSKPLNELRRCIGMKEVESTRVPNAEWIREKLGVSERFASRLGEYCDPDGVNQAVKEYRKKHGLSEDVPLCNEILEVLENESLRKQIMDSIQEGQLVDKVLQVYKLGEGVYGMSLLKTYSSLTPMKTYESEQLGTGPLDGVVDELIRLMREDSSLHLIVKRGIANEINDLIIQKSLQKLEEE
nr:MAG TPA: hypothetical protein [Caudoviricetes sp.]